MHNQPPNLPESTSPAQTVTRGVVICVHEYGVGVYLPEARDFGHVDVPELGVVTARYPTDYPKIGAVLLLTVFGRSGLGQLRLGVTA